MKTPGRLWAERRARRAHRGPNEPRQAWRRFAHNIAWFTLIVAIVVIVMVLLSR